MSNVFASNLRISSLAIALFDVLATIPGELRLYSRQTSLVRPSPACILFILIRYLSIAALVTSSVGFFGHHFSKEACSHYYLVAPLLKMFATLVSQAIIFIRTYAISRKSRWVFIVLATLFVLCLVPEIMGNAAYRIPLQKPLGSCTSGNSPNRKVAWLHYLAAMIYDGVAMGIATYYLYGALPRGVHGFSGLALMLLQEGLLYFATLTAVNLLNLILFRRDNTSIQSAATTLGQAITMIFSQKIILHLSDSIVERTSGMHASGSNAHPSIDTRGRLSVNTKGMMRHGAYVGAPYSPRTPMSGATDRFELGGVRVERRVEVLDDDGLESAGSRHTELEDKHSGWT